MLMTRQRSFAIPTDGDPIYFDVAGQTFICRPQIATGVVLRLGEIAGRSDDERRGGEVIKALRDFFQAALFPPDYARFNKMLDDPEIAIPLSTLNEIAGWLAEEYTGDRPTGQPSPPTLPPGSSGGGSTGTT
jgi:hypothetical protein